MCRSPTVTNQYKILRMYIIYIYIYQLKQQVFHQSDLKIMFIGNTISGLWLDTITEQQCITSEL